MLAVTILADHRERRSGVPDRLTQLGLDVDLVTLPVGDFVLADRVVVERKTIHDLHRSIARGKLWRQIAAIRNAAFATRYLLVEGECLWDGPIVPEGIRGALLAVSESEVIVVRARDVGESAAWIRSMVVRSQSAPAPRRARRRQPRASSSHALLRTLPGVTPGVARGLLTTFGSVARVAVATEAELLAVRGVGPATAATLKRFLSEPEAP